MFFKRRKKEPAVIKKVYVVSIGANIVHKSAIISSTITVKFLKEHNLLEALVEFEKQEKIANYKRCIKEIKEQ